MILKLSILFFASLVLNCQLFAVSVLVSKEAIKYEQKIDSSKVIEKDVDKIPNKSCEPLTLEQLNSAEFITNHYIIKNSIICTKDVKNIDKESIIFNFGGLKIEKKGKIIYENDEFIRFKNLDGTVETIYKDGRLK